MFLNRSSQPADRVYNLGRLFVFRSAVMACELAAILIVAYGLEVPLPVESMLAVMGGYTLFHLYAAWRLRRGHSASAGEFFLNLVVDVLVLALLFYHAGGSGNPFVSLFLLPLVIVATSLPRPYVLGMAAVTLACYSLLMVVHVPLAGSGMHAAMAMPGMGRTSGFALHVLGMWFSFLVGVGVILFFVTSLAEELRRRDRHLVEIREKQLRDEHVIALGTMAAGAAHEMGTPLATMAVLSAEMERQYAGQGELPAQLAIIRGQVERCKATLSQISASAGQIRAEGGHRSRLDVYLEQLLDKWQQEHTATRVSIRRASSGPAPEIVVDTTLDQAIQNILNNAADASPQGIEVGIDWSDDLLVLTIRDFGRGVDPQVAQQVAKPFFTTKPDGQGLGLFLAQAVVGRLGGELDIRNHEDGGAQVTIRLPLAKLAA